MFTLSFFIDFVFIIIGGKVKPLQEQFLRLFKKLLTVNCDFSYPNANNEENTVI
jgi:hypothetical protein